MNINSALEIYKDISAGSAQINPLSDYFQESEDNMKTMSPIFEGKGITRDIHVQMPFSCAGKLPGTQDHGCDASLPSEAVRMEAEDIPQPYMSDMYDYSKGVFFDYSKQDYQKVEQFMQSCDPLTEDTNTCLRRIFECGEDEWDVCKKYIDYCPGRSPGVQNTNVICKYNINKELIRQYVASPIQKATTQPFCEIGETPEQCAARSSPAPESPVPIVAADNLMFQRRGVGEFYASS